MGGTVSKAAGVRPQLEFVLLPEVELAQRQEEGPHRRHVPPRGHGNLPPPPAGVGDSKDDMKEKL